MAEGPARVDRTCAPRTAPGPAFPAGLPRTLQSRNFGAGLQLELAGLDCAPGRRSRAESSVNLGTERGQSVGRTAQVLMARDTRRGR